MFPWKSHFQIKYGKVVYIFTDIQNVENVFALHRYCFKMYLFYAGMPFHRDRFIYMVIGFVLIDIKIVYLGSFLKHAFSKGFIGCVITIDTLVAISLIILLKTFLIITLSSIYMLSSR